MKESTFHRGRFFIGFMITALVGQKLKQTQVFTEDGKRLPVTVITAGPCWVLRTIDETRVQVGYGIAKHQTQAQKGLTKKAGLTQQPRFLRELPVTEDMPAIGSSITVDAVFQVGDMISVTGTSKGKGFAGVVRRHGFAGGPRTHGQSDRERAPGSIGSTTTPGRVFRGKRMAGRMGSDKVTLTGLRVVSVDAANNQMTISGIVPGAKQGLLFIQKV